MSTVYTYGIRPVPCFGHVVCTGRVATDDEVKAWRLGLLQNIKEDLECEDPYRCGSSEAQKLAASYGRNVVLFMSYKGKSVWVRSADTVFGTEGSAQEYVNMLNKRFAESQHDVRSIISGNPIMEQS